MRSKLFASAGNNACRLIPPLDCAIFDLGMLLVVETDISTRLINLGVMDDPTGTLDTLHDKAKHGNLTKIIEFCARYFQLYLTISHPMLNRQ